MITLKDAPIVLSKWAGSAVMALWTAVGPAAQGLTLLSGVSLASSLCAAWISGTLSRKFFFTEVVRSAAVLLTVYATHIFSTSTVHVGVDIGVVAAIAFSVDKMARILVDLKDCGVPIPETLDVLVQGVIRRQRVLDKMIDKLDNRKEKSDA